jgi:hypothetical protein
MSAADLLRSIVDAGLTVEVDGRKLVIRPGSRLTDDLRAAIKTAGPALLAMLTPEPHRPFALSEEDGHRAHDVPWTEAEIARCIGRITLFMKRGLTVGDADDLAEQRHLRDIVLDERVSCIECSNYRPGTTRPCGNVKAAGVREVGPATATLLQRCGGFAPVLLPTNLDGVDLNSRWSR